MTYVLGGEGLVVCVIMTHCKQKLICDSSLIIRKILHRKQIKQDFSNVNVPWLIKTECLCYNTNMRPRFCFFRIVSLLLLLFHYFNLVKTKQRHIKHIKTSRLPFLVLSMNLMIT